MCPHCGWKYEGRGGLVPIHFTANPGGRCQGSGQVPRNAESDKRPLWTELDHLRHEGHAD